VVDVAGCSDDDRTHLRQRGPGSQVPGSRYGSVSWLV
jgi:hypothetical protein